MRVHIGFIFGDFTFVNQRLNVGVVIGAANKLAAMKVVNPRIASMYPVTVARWIDQKSSHRAVRFHLGRNCSQLDDSMGFFNNLLQHYLGIVYVWRITFKQLLGCHHDLVRGLATAAAPTHAVRHDAQQATCHAMMTDQVDLILLVITVTLVDARGCGDSVAV